MPALHEHDAVTLAAMLGRGEVSSEEVTAAHLARIDAVDGRVRAFTTVLRDEARAAARRADEERRRGEVRGPLHGLPVSVKESLDMAGMASTMGVTARRHKVAASDAGIVHLLRAAGAVILGRTNTSQLLLFHESDNPVYGRTHNPFDLGRTPGGSSGGEAAAVAAGMSPLGVGTDIGGSIRVPAHFTGIAGLKPTLDRWINQGSNTAFFGQEVVRGQCGPMARTARDVALFFEAIEPRAMSALDPRVPPLPSADRAADVDVSSLRVGRYADDGGVPASAAVSRAVQRAAEALRGRVREVVDFIPPRMQEMTFVYMAALSSDGGATAFDQLEGGPLAPALRPMRAMARLPDPVRRAMASAASLAGEPRLARFLGALGRKSVTELWRLTQLVRAYRFELLAAMRNAGVDVLLCPAHATPALPHDASRDFTLAGSASMLFNLTQMPAGVVPVTTVRPDEAHRERPADRMEKRAAEVDAGSSGLPVGVQVVAAPWREDRVLAVMMALEQAVRGDDGFPKTPTG
jgi:fatty acid amide hydrolase